jgi:hypothetical protein
MLTDVKSKLPEKAYSPILATEYSTNW